jgi:fructose-1,6-bisphosphatase
MPNLFERQKVIDVIQSLQEKIKILKGELMAFGGFALDNEDLALKIENTKLENEKMMKDIDILKNQMMDLEVELNQLVQQKFSVEMEEILDADEKVMDDLKNNPKKS